MTTKVQHTPYDAEIAVTRGEYTRASLISTRDGYRRAKAEDADLLAAAEQAIHDLEDMSSNPYAKGLKNSCRQSPRRHRQGQEGSMIVTSNNNLIATIRVLRQQKDWGLRQAKEALDAQESIPLDTTLYLDLLGE